MGGYGYFRDELSSSTSEDIAQIFSRFTLQSRQWARLTIPGHFPLRPGERSGFARDASGSWAPIARS